ncbi:sialic acid-binding Ig-like lectin 14 isoform X2 [Gadus macrocephalus]|uniref:sialic acid-binding Ig-like lectin 14 isoform X2 n=1 Tax=Gadus macrocephalus TaxID=80720 RepID=UPI0028CB6A13|nr:sialic acid-binding Ig-like lectin 14 isoform X2 [Gadus macrocephalus]
MLSILLFAAAWVACLAKLLDEKMTGSWRLFLLCSLLQGAGCNAAKFEALMPASVTTLSGSCVTVPCSFTLEDGYKDKLHPGCIPIWQKDQITISATTFRGNLTAYNCTTTFNNVLEDNVQYCFRIECGNPLNYTFKENPVTIQIKGLPDAPRLTPPKEPVVEGTPVELGCSAPSYCDTHPPTVTWTPALGLSTQLQQNDTVTSTLTFNASHLHHGNNVSCTAAYYIPSGNKTVTSTRYQLSILFAPRNTSAVGSPCLPARVGGCLNLTCTSHANPAVSAVTWYRIHGEHILKIGTGSSLSVQLWNANYVFFCEARNEIGTEKSDVYKIDIQANEYYSYSPALGSGRGTPFVTSGEGSITGVKVWEHPGNYIAGLQLRYGTRWDRLIGRAVHAPLRLDLFEGETITQVSGKYHTSHYIYQLIFGTSSGRSLIAGQPVLKSFNFYPEHEEAELRILSGRFDGGGITSLGAHWGLAPEGYGNSTS